MTKLSLQKVSVAFGGLKALEDVTMSVPAGEIRGVIGPNGAGKTTLLNVVTGVNQPDTGDVQLDGASIRGLKTSQIAARGLGRTFQTSKMFKGMTVLENVMTGLHGFLKAEPWTAALNFKRVRDEERDAAAKSRAILDFVGMRQFEDYDASDLSFGQQRVIEIARALIGEPKVLLLDEPAVGLSAVRVDELDRLLRRIRDEKGVTIVMIEHVVQLVMGVCDRITVLNSGRVIAEGGAEDVARHPAVVEAYLGRAIGAAAAAGAGHA
ncbi:MAG: ABC transporter ATP-binding protein [Alphaproteobacteria bacterium]|nr:ABC transporter ATP-binding protein [Alphaproteobacteria bacterium]